MLTLPTTSRCPTNEHPGRRQRQTRPRTFCFHPQTGHRLDVPRSEPVKLSMWASAGFIGEIGDIPAVLPLAHPLVVMASAAMVPDPMGIPDKQTTHPVLLTKGDHRPRALVAQVSDLPPLPGAGFLSGRLQAPRAAGAFPAPLAFPGDLAQSLVVPPLERTDTSAGHHQGYSRSGRHRRLVDLAQVRRGLGGAGRRVHRRSLHGAVQFVPVLPHQLAGPTLLGRRSRQEPSGAIYWSAGETTRRAAGALIQGPVNGLGLLAPHV